MWHKNLNEFRFRSCYQRLKKLFKEFHNFSQKTENPENWILTLCSYSYKFIHEFGYLEYFQEGIELQTEVPDWGNDEFSYSFHRFFHQLSVFEWKHIFLFQYLESSANFSMSRSINFLFIRRISLKIKSKIFLLPCCS